MKSKDLSDQKRHILKKNVSTIHINARLTLIQRKLVNALLYNAYDGLLSDDTHSVSVPVLSEMIGYDSRNQRNLREAIRGLTETSVEWDILEDDGTEVWEVSSLLSSARIRAGVCTYRYDKGLAEKLKHPEIYSKINLSVIRELRSSHALALYENCHRYVDIGNTGWWDLETFRKLMAVDDLASYQEYKILRRDLITPAMNEINKLSNIHIELETKRRGRSVTGLRFLVKYNNQLSLVGMEEEDDITQTRAYKALIAEGISKTLARAWVLEHDEDYILEKLDLAHNNAASGKIKSSKAGFLKSAIEQDYHNENAEKKRRLQAAQEAKQREAKMASELEVLKGELRELETAYRKECTRLMEEVFEALPVDAQEAASEEFLASLTAKIFADNFRRNSWADRLNHPAAMKFWEERGLDFPTLQGWAQKSGSIEPLELRSQIEELEEKLKK